mmetsp:Transcript_2329/g.8288  ORF Transcript_2329/g.8288 Transcript_2329/m.8288 type:complete len:82 (+) Transcript_2329:42-287(+)|eukprot:CAMPEP_0114620656 /NCGR_PEP_ID=MMETSP0168-20121206/8837_1 /TAXON_ID=95228 ORGANISM="Vannella sp., Strain DIVA3 517/6/12" /NCGR_SAMPLE_ID=MMETSP0168 /ASSEMBLY_ACC=CAM_ASM_000044 /LENGTH=81 /DNA_ID=CAMNT_0001831853 /DNA_START=42 /DNA_END=287 /DNA_ORIENTATION=-
MAEGKTFTMEQVAAHDKPEDMWLVIEGKVYDVTDFADEHPGGPELLEEEAGTDATELFEDAGHSDAARDMLVDYYIGDLAK